MAWWKTKALPRTEARKKAVLETVFAGFGAILAAGTIATILWKAVAGTGVGPAVEVSILGVEAQGGVYRAEIEVFNRGDAAAAGVEVKGTVTRDGETAETASATFDYVPSQSRRRGGLYFSADPRTGALTVAPTSYVTP